MGARCHGVCDRISFKGFIRSYVKNTYSTTCSIWINKLHLKKGKQGFASFCPCCGGRVRWRKRFNHHNRMERKRLKEESIPKNKPICKIVFGGEK